MSIAFSQDNNWIAYGSFDNNVYIHSMQPSPGNGGDDDNGTDGIINDGELPETGPNQTILALLGLVLIPILSFNLWYHLSRPKKRI